MTDDNDSATAASEILADPPQALAAPAGAGVPTLDQPVPQLFRTREALCEAADQAASGVPAPFQQSVFLYYIARYLVSVYEARYSELPIQVWNEYRNALDHFMRHLSAAGDLASDSSHHLSRMEGHVQRAVLDVTKMLCLQCHDAINQDLQHWGPEVFDLVDLGNFRAEVRLAQQEAVDLFEHAKTNDSQMGQYAWLNRQVIERFLDAFFAFDRILRSFAERHLALTNAKRQWEALTARNDQLREQAIEAAQAEIRPKALRRSIYVGLGTGLPLMFIGAALGWWLSYRYPPPSTPTTTLVAAPTPAMPSPPTAAGATPPAVGGTSASAAVPSAGTSVAPVAKPPVNTNSPADSAPTSVPPTAAKRQNKYP